MGCSKGQILNLDLGNGNHDYLVLEANGDIVKLFCLYNVITCNFGNSQEYFRSKIDQYLENKFYSSLSPQVQRAIIPENINQYEYEFDPDVYFINNHESFADLKTQKVIGNATRNIYLLDVDDIEKYFNNSFTSKDLRKLFQLNNHYWTRSASSSDSNFCWCVDGSRGYVGSNDYTSSNAVRPAFKIDLSKI